MADAPLSPAAVAEIAARSGEKWKGVSSNKFRRGVARLAKRKVLISEVSENSILKFKV